jgi:hypothetical protein
LEKQIFFSISVLRTYDTLKTSTNESRVEDQLRKLESKVDMLSSKLDNVLTISNNHVPVGDKRKELGKLDEERAPVKIKPHEKALKNKEDGNRSVDDDEGLF